jgi:hypothetical protein
MFTLLWRCGMHEAQDALQVICVAQLGVICALATCETHVV